MGDKPLKSFNLIFNERNFRDKKSLSKMLGLEDKDQRHIFYSLYRFWIDHVFHATSNLYVNNNPYFTLYCFGYGHCNETTNAMAILYSAFGIPNRPVPLHGHVLMEVKPEEKWVLLDSDLDALFYLWDNKTLASYVDILQDPLLAIRTKVFGKESKWNIDNSWFNASRFEYIQPRHENEITIDVSIIPQMSEYQYDLFPNETLRFLYEKTLFSQIGDLKGSEINSRVARQVSLGIIEYQVNLNERRKEPHYVINTAYPIYHVKNISISPIIVDGEKLNSGQTKTYLDDVKFNLNVDSSTMTGKLLVTSQGHLKTFPSLKTGENTVEIQGEQNWSEINLMMELNNDLLSSKKPLIGISNTNKHFNYQRPFFEIDSKGNQFEKIWWQISRDDKFHHIIPNYDQIDNFKSKITFSEISETFISNQESYYFRIKGSENGIWSDWTQPTEFQVTKPPRVNEIRGTYNENDLITLDWDYDHDNVTFLIFGSNALDFVPDIYSRKHIDEMEGTRVIQSTDNKNRIGKSSHTKIQIENKYSHYRIIVEKYGVYSVPSPIYSHALRNYIFLKSGIYQEYIYKKSSVLQNRRFVKKDYQTKEIVGDLNDVQRRMLLFKKYDDPLIVINKKGLKAIKTSNGIQFVGEKKGEYHVRLYANPHFNDSFMKRTLRKIKWLYIYDDPFSFYDKYYEHQSITVIVT